MTGIRSYDWLIMPFINKKIEIVYDGKIGDGLFKKQLLKLNQDQKKNSNQEIIY